MNNQERSSIFSTCSIFSSGANPENARVFFLPQQKQLEEFLKKKKKFIKIFRDKK